MIKESVVDNWGEALKNIAVSEKMVDRFLDEANVIINLLKEKEDFVKLLSVHNLKFTKTKFEIIETVFAKNGVNQYFINAMKILIDENIFYYWRSILKNMRKKITSLQNIVYGVAWSTIPLTAKQLKTMETKMSNRFAKDVRLVNKLDSTLLGGVQLVVGKYLIDGSIKGKIDQLRNQTLNRE